MPRYVIERNFGTISDDDMLAASALSDELISARFPEIVWEHSHIVATDDGEIVTFCIYAAPVEEMIREHAEAFGSHSITNLYELLDDVTPTEVRRRAAAASGLAVPEDVRQPGVGDRARARDPATPFDVGVREELEGAGEERHRLLVGVPLEGPVGCALRKLDRRLDVAAVRGAGTPVQRDLGESRPRVQAIAGRERVRSRPVETGTAAGAESRVDRVARERVGEAVPSSADGLRSTRPRPPRRASAPGSRRSVLRPLRARVFANDSPSTAAAASTLAQSSESRSTRARTTSRIPSGTSPNEVRGCSATWRASSRA